MISFVCDVVDCILRILVIQLTLCFPLPTVFVDLSLGEVFLHPSIAIPWLNHSIDFSKFKISTLSSIITWSLHLFIIQLVITASVLSDNYTTKSTIITPDHSIGQALGHHSIGFLPLSHSIDFKNIPVTTRSITKCGLQNEVSFVSPRSFRPTCFNTTTMPWNHSIGFNTTRNHSIGFTPTRNHSIGFNAMPITTRSTMKSGLQNDVSSVPPPYSYLTCLLDIHKARPTTNTSLSSFILSALIFRISTVDIEYLKGASQQNHFFNHLREYYKEFKTRRQLNLEVPAGCHRDSNIQDFLTIAPVSDNLRDLLGDVIIHELKFEVSVVSKKVNNFIYTLRQYYGEIPTKRQLHMEVPAGLQNLSFDFVECMTLFLAHLGFGSRRVLIDCTLSSEDLWGYHINSTLSYCQDQTNATPSDSFTNSSSLSSVPILRSLDELSPSLLSRLTFSEDTIRASASFGHNYNSINRNMNQKLDFYIGFTTVFIVPAGVQQEIFHFEDALVEFYLYGPFVTVAHGSVGAFAILLAYGDPVIITGGVCYTEYYTLRGWLAGGSTVPLNFTHSTIPERWHQLFEASSGLWIFCVVTWVIHTRDYVPLPDNVFIAVYTECSTFLLRSVLDSLRCHFNVSVESIVFVITSSVDATAWPICQCFDSICSLSVFVISMASCVSVAPIYSSSDCINGGTDITLFLLVITTSSYPDVFGIAFQNFIVFFWGGTIC